MSKLNIEQWNLRPSKLERIKNQVSVLWYPWKTIAFRLEFHLLRWTKLIKRVISTTWRKKQTTN